MSVKTVDTTATLPPALEKLSNVDAFVGPFLQKAIQAQCLSPAWVFVGPNAVDLYRASQSLAQTLLCTQRTPDGLACGTCKDCRWTEANQHPSIITLSRHSGLDDEALDKIKKTKKAATTIAVSQIQGLIQHLGMSSDTLRVVILTDGECFPTTEESTPRIAVPMETLESPFRGQWVPQGLSHKVLSDSSSNKLLKTLEEPPDNVLFILLTHQVGQLMETIVSRCQVLPFLPSDQPLEPPHPFFESLWANLIGYTNADDLHQNISAFAKEHDWPVERVLEQWIESAQAQWKRSGQLGLLEAKAFGWLHARLEWLEVARQQVRDKVNPELVLAQLCFQLCHGQ
jgi:DNA polymerase III delta prime subunit